MGKKVILRLKVQGKRFSNRDAEKLRGYLGSEYQEELLFHNHLEKFVLNYQSAKINYKVLNGDLAIVGINEGAEAILENCRELKKVKINDELLDVEKEFGIEEYELKVEDELKYSYKILTPWFALNQDNYKKYRSGDLDLNIQMRNNILEFFKMNQVWIKERIEVVGEFKEILITQKNTKILGFLGEFKCNVKLPDYIGLGKRKSIGFGTIEMIK